MSVRQFVRKFDISDRQAKRLLRYHTYFIYLFLYTPIAIVVLLSFTSRSIPVFPIEGFSLKWYGNLVPPDYNEQLINALFRSIQTGILSALGSGIIGTMAVFGMVRSDYSSRLLSAQ